MNLQQFIELCCCPVWISLPTELVTVKFYKISKLLPENFCLGSVLQSFGNAIVIECALLIIDPAEYHMNNMQSPLFNDLKHTWKLGIISSNSELIGRTSTWYYHHCTGVHLVLCWFLFQRMQPDGRSLCKRQNFSYSQRFCFYCCKLWLHCRVFYVHTSLRPANSRKSRSEQNSV